MEQGGTVAAAFTGMVGETAPTVETDLGNVQAVRLRRGWRAIIPAAYKASGKPGLKFEKTSRRKSR